ncbi:MAG: hypothetical protein B6244_01875 [Candidatus Cloacimonetes bacterium 4572_55]|nr:MAG: hypothetical protein B6244_01875 [Candidatus Cloacimonetes bacterium 4572_55]
MSRFFTIRGTLTNRDARFISLIGIFLLLSVWSLFSYSGWAPKLILPTPTAVLKAFPTLHWEHALVRNAVASFYRITMGFLLASIVAVPLGITMGAFPSVKAFFRPLVDPLRFLPIAALVGLFIVWFGIGNAMKIMLLFTGIAVYMTPLIVESVEGVDQVYLSTSYTLGASKWQVICHVLAPAALPTIFEALRVMNAIGWTYIILAEAISGGASGSGGILSSGGLGNLIIVAQKRSHTDQIFALIITILVIGVMTDLALRWTNKKMFFWKEN